jgi:tetratricopeptide (TPR) repeat protein
VLNRLSHSRSLTVVARSSSFAIDTEGLDAAQIGRRLGARFLVQGGVQRAGDRVRVTVQLVDAASGRQIDAMRFDKTTADLFALQDEIAAKVAGSLDVKFAAGPPVTRDPEAQLAYLQGLELLGRWRVAESEAALARFVRARALDPQFAAAYVGEARARRQAAFLRGENPAPRTPELKALVARALALDPQLGPAYVLRGMMTDDPAAAEADLRRGIELSPSDAAAHLALGELLSVLPGRSSEALAALDRAVALDPLQPRAAYLRAIVRYARDGGQETFEEDLRAVLEIDPQYPSALTRLGLLRAAADGAVADGLSLLERSLAADPTAWFAIQTAAELYLVLGYADKAAALVGDGPRGDALRLAIALQRGDAATAARLALPTRQQVSASAKPVSAVATVGELAAVVALRDEAVRSGRIDDGIRVLRDHHCTPLERMPPQEAASAAGTWGECVSAWTLPGAVALAQLEYAHGERERGKKIARGVLAFLDSEESRQLPHPYVASSRARALAVLGRWDEAITALESATRARAGLLGWWVIARDSVFDPIGGHPRFKAVKRAAEDELARERERYEKLGPATAAFSAAPPSPATAGSAARTAR